MANPIVPPLPAPLPVSKTCVYKVVGKTSIPLDIYLPTSKNGQKHPIMLFIHGGGWLGANRTDYCRPLFYQFLKLGFVVAAMDYRLRPETSLEGQLSDVRDVEGWLRNYLGSETRVSKTEVDSEKIVVVGASAGAHLALLTPKLWTTQPNAVLSMYGPTNMHSLPYLERFSKRSTLPCTPDVLAAATNYNRPPTEQAIVTDEDYAKPRSVMGMTVFRKSIITEFLIKGLVRQEDGTLRLPEPGCVKKEEVDAISPLYLCKHVVYPPTYLLHGTADDVFDTSHIHSFHHALEAQSIPIEKVLVPDVKHAFDSRAEIGGDIHRNIINPAVAWVAGFVGVVASY